ncbi:MAG: DUF5777 family beta-barrel protein [Saprospiraceae bacterium]|nr:DUF5777 family beta-barrel protein [Saprospiraceae bacterium]
MTIKTLLTFISLSILSLLGQQAHAQSSLLDELGEDEVTTEYAKYSFKTNRVINLHSLENTAAGVMDFKMSHRFNPVSNGFYDLFGLDGAQQRFGFDFGLTDNLTVGVNRNSYRKAYDGFVKYRLLRQSTGKVNMPITLALMTSAAIETQSFDNPNRENYFSSRLFYTTQLILGRKFSETFTLELVPTYVHRNLVSTTTEKNDVFALAIGGRVRLTKRVAFTGEYMYVLPNQLLTNYKNMLAVGFDIETGGHVFQLHFTNSPSMSEYSFTTQNENDFFGQNGIRFGFNVSRVFTLWETKKVK